jgi:hypothetical protein
VWLPLIRDLAVIAERQGASAEVRKVLLNLEGALLDPWHLLEGPHD